MTTEFARMFSNEALDRDEDELLYDKTNIKILLNRNGTEHSTQFPLVKMEFIFDPKFTIHAVCNAMKSERHRRRWDPFITENKVLKTSESQRYQVVYT